MTRRGWTWALGLVACGTLLPACTRTVPGVVGGTTVDGLDPQAVAAGPSSSPYNTSSTLPNQLPTIVNGSGGSGQGSSTIKPAMPALAITPSSAQAKPLTEEHRDTLPPLDPTPGEMSESSVPHIAAPDAVSQSLIRTVSHEQSTQPGPGGAVARLPGLAPADASPSKSHPDHLPTMLPLPDKVTPKAQPVLSAQSPKAMAAAGSAAADPPLVLAMRSFLDKHPGEALMQLKGYDKNNQEMLLQLLPLAARLSESPLNGSNPKDLNFYTDQLQDLLVQYRPKLDLVMDRLCFCQDIRGFGMYKPLGDCPVFHPGHCVHIYVEVRNFASEKQRDGSYVTQLRTSAQIVTRDRKEPVWPPGGDRFVFHRDGPDVCQSLRHDYFDHCYFTLPTKERLPPGSYTLTIQVEDVPTRRVVRGSLDFIVRSDVGVPDR